MWSSSLQCNSSPNDSKTIQHFIMGNKSPQLLLMVKCWESCGHYLQPLHTWWQLIKWARQSVGTRLFSIIQQVLSDSHRKHHTLLAVRSSRLTGGRPLGKAARCQGCYQISNSFPKRLNGFSITRLQLEGSKTMWERICLFSKDFI